jgi:hypothetical protein
VRVRVRPVAVLPERPLAEDDLALDYERNRAESTLPWDRARHATRAAWMKVSGAVAPRDTERGI